MSEGRAEQGSKDIEDGGSPNGHDSPASRGRVFVGPSEHPWFDDGLDAVGRGGGDVVPASEAQAVVWLGGSIDELRSVMHPGTRWVQLPSAGVEPWVDLFDGQRVYTSARGIYAETVAEHVMAMILAAAREIPANSRSQTWDGGLPRQGRMLRGSTVLLIGAGGIGEAVIRLIEPFGVRTVAVTRSGRVVPGAYESLDPSGVPRALPEADFVVLSAPATPTTRHLIGPDELAAMRSSAWLINVGRGSAVDTGALVTALREERIGGAALDVTDPEPLPDGHPLWGEPNVLITPHVANPKAAQLTRLLEHIEGNVRRFIADEPLASVVDVDAGY